MGQYDEREKLVTTTVNWCIPFSRCVSGSLFRKMHCHQSKRHLSPPANDDVEGYGPSRTHTRVIMRLRVRGQGIYGNPKSEEEERPGCSLPVASSSSSVTAAGRRGGRVEGRRKTRRVCSNITLEAIDDFHFLLPSKEKIS